MTITQNRNLFLAEKILEFIETRPNLVIFLPTEPNETLTLSDQFLPKLFGEMAKSDIAQGFLSLERQGVLEYENWKDTHREDYDKIKFFDITPKKSEIVRFISDAKNNLYGFKLSDEVYRRELIEILGSLISGGNADIKKFNEKKYGNEILRKISDFSGAIQIEETLEVDFEKDESGEVYASGGGYFPSFIVINNKEKLEDIFYTVKKTIEEIYEEGVKALLKDRKELIWRCVECSRWLGTYTSEQEIMKLLDEFQAGGHKTCHKCRTKNVFSISQKGGVDFKTIAK